MKPAPLIVTGFVMGAAIAAAWLGRYQMTLTSAEPGVGYVSRLDRWTGRVQSASLMPYGGEQEHFIPAAEWDALGSEEPVAPTVHSSTTVYPLTNAIHAPIPRGGTNPHTQR